MNIYVGNLPYGVNDDDLHQMFGEFGPVSSVNIIKDRDTGTSKGFGFVEMANSADGEQAIKDLHETALQGRNIKVNEARPRDDSPKRKSW
jgi:RNA recognition motif-containing protein